MRSTHTLAQLPLSPEAFTEIRDALIAAGYDHAVLTEEDGTMLDMTGIGLVQRAETPQGWDGATATGPTDEEEGGAVRVCDECGVNPADHAGKLCAGCHAYRDHTA